MGSKALGRSCVKGILALVYCCVAFVLRECVCTSVSTYMCVCTRVSVRVGKCIYVLYI